jgi:polynucleotide 5'-hydroxyl-kinase GRC3/NOL9
MLSAVAARKAALAARQDTTDSLVRPEIVSPPPTPSPVSTPPSKPVSKRKPSAQVSNTSRKAKKKKIRHEKTRYFAPVDSFVQQDDVIVIDENNPEESDSEEDEIEEGGPPPASTSKSVIFKKPSLSKGNRGWSPSNPLQDSSDEEVDDGEEEPFIPDTPVPMKAPRPTFEERTPLSTFKPKWNSNIFALSSEEMGFLESSSPIADSAIGIILPLGETLTLLGTYALNVIHGSVSLGGVTLFPSRHTHHVFAPRCSPVLVLQCVQSNGIKSNPIATSITDRLRPFSMADCAIVVLREFSTGVEGLGRVCRTFDGVFEPSRWHRGDTVPDLGLTGIRMVQTLYNSVCGTF